MSSVILAPATPPASCLGCEVRKLTVYRTAGAEAFAQSPFVDRLRVSFEAKQTILQDGEVPAHIHIVYSGWAARVKQLADGRRQILSFVLPGDLVVRHATAGKPLPFSVRSVTRVALCAFEIGAFTTFMRSSVALLQSAA